MNVIYSLLLTGFIVLAMPAALAEPDDSAAALLAKQLSTMDSLRAHFQQQIKDHRGTLLQQASGTVSVKRPRRLHWRTEQPYQHLVVTDGITLWLYDIDLEQVSRQAFSADLDKAPALLLSGDIEQISKQYTVAVAAQSAGELSFTLTPLTADSLFKKLTVDFSEQRLAAMSLHDSFDQITQFTFSKVQLNPDVDEQLFQFTPPAGIDVISNES